MVIRYITLKKEVKKDNTSLLIKDVKGVHDIYLTLETSERPQYQVGKAGDVFSVKFEKVNAKYAFNYDAFGFYPDYSAGTKTILSFKNDEDNPQSILYSLAMYFWNSMSVQRTHLHSQEFR